MSKIVFGKKIDMNLLVSPTNGSIIVGYHKGGGGFPRGSLLQKNGLGEVSYVGIGVTNKTKSEIDTLISTNTLIPGTLYKITGVHPTLYNDGTNSGTSIYLTSLTTNTLSKEGHGEFYNPKYNKSIITFGAEWGIWSDKSSWTSLISSGVFNQGELITADNGATGKLFSVLETNLFIPFSGNWSTAVSITGNVSLATASVSAITLHSYLIGDKAIWGGYSWTNITGSLGSFDNSLSLDATNWSKDTYDEVNYNKVLDIIEYDVIDDWIITRQEINSNNIVTNIKGELQFVVAYPWQANISSISVFQFGFSFNPDLYLGLANNTIKNSWCDNINFQGKYYMQNIINGFSYYGENIYHGTQSYIEQINLQTYSTISDNIGIQFTCSNIFSDVSIIKNNVTINGIINNVKLNAGEINIGIDFPLKAKNLTKLKVENGSITGDISTATILFADYSKTVFKSSTGTNRLRYYNDTGIVITTVTA
jgi:hypothetical protein